MSASSLSSYERVGTKISTRIEVPLLTTYTSLPVQKIDAFTAVSFMACTSASHARLFGLHNMLSVALLLLARIVLSALIVLLCMIYGYMVALLIGRVFLPPF